MIQIKLETREECETLEGISAATIIDCTDVKQIADKFAKEFGFNKSKYYLVTGSDMNKAYKLTGDNAYRDDIQIVAFDLRDFDTFNQQDIPVDEYIKIRSNGVRWFDDIVSNDLYAEREMRREQRRARRLASK
jgi:hypothetical protein